MGFTVVTSFAFGTIWAQYVYPPVSIADYGWMFAIYGTTMLIHRMLVAEE